MKQSLPLAVLAAAAATVAAMLQAIPTVARRVTAHAAPSGPPPPPPTDPPAVPPLTGNWVYSYALNGCSDREIADRFLVEERALQRDYADVLRSTRGLRSYMLRKGQTDVATGKNAPMLTWLGRNELGQSLNPATPGVAEPEVE